MIDCTPEDRTALGNRLQQFKNAAAEQATERFLEEHPDWLVKYGERARVYGIQDAGYHLDFLRGAVEAGSSQAFADYCEWASGVLGSRGIATRFLIEHLNQIETVLGPKLSAEQRTWVADFLEAGRAACGRQQTRPARPKSALSLSCKIYLQSILGGNRLAAMEAVETAVKNGASILEIYSEIFQESLYEVGRLWEAGKISVSVEHRATAITQFVMAALYSRAMPAGPSEGARHAVVTGVAGELHQIGANMVADVLEEAGWNVAFLGTDAPYSGILAAIQEQRADLLCISATVLFNVPNVFQLIREVRASSQGLRILIGGSAFRAKPQLWSEIGADGFAPDLHSAIAAADRLVPSP